MEQLFSIESLEEDFANEQEDLTADLSGICIYLIRNIHDSSYEMTVEVYGKGGISAFPIVSEIIHNPEEYLGHGFAKHAICPKCVSNLFDENILALLIARDLRIFWNQDWQSSATIDPANIHKTHTLAAEDQ